MAYTLTFSKEEKQEGLGVDDLEDNTWYTDKEGDLFIVSWDGTKYTYLLGAGATDSISDVEVMEDFAPFKKFSGSFTVTQE